MDPGGMAKLNLVQILPEFEEGGVERHVLWLANELARRGHRVMVISAGGKLESLLDNVCHWKLPVHKKNPLTGLYCAICIAHRARKEGWQILHSHSRVPSWIAWWASSISGIPWVATCHARYSLNKGLIPYRYAKNCICVSEVVRKHLNSFLCGEPRVIYNGLQGDASSWTLQKDHQLCKFLFVGRLTRIKGIELLLNVLPDIQGPWRLDILGEGALLTRLKDFIHDADLERKVFFHGFRDDVDKWMDNCSFLLFPSLDEGMPLTLCRAIQKGVPLLASDIPAVRELTGGSVRLFRSGDPSALKTLIRQAMAGDPEDFICPYRKIPSIEDMTKEIEEVYSENVSRLSAPGFC